MEVVDGQLFLGEPSAWRPVFALRVAAACQRLCRASVRAPLRTLHRVRAFFWEIRHRHGYRPLTTPHTQERQSADERSARGPRVNHARVKQLLEMFFSLHRRGIPGKLHWSVIKEWVNITHQLYFVYFCHTLTGPWTVSLLPHLVSCDQRVTARLNSAPTVHITAVPVWQERIYTFLRVARWETAVN